MSSQKQHENLVFFIDRSLGAKIIAQHLREHGVLVEVHDDHFPPDAPDEDWLAFVGKKGWIALTKDKMLRHRKAQLNTIRSSNARVIVVRAHGTTGGEIARIFIEALPRLRQYILEGTPPFIIGLTRTGKISRYSEWLSS